MWLKVDECDFVVFLFIGVFVKFLVFLFGNGCFNINVKREILVSSCNNLFFEKFVIWSYYFWKNVDLLFNMCFFFDIFSIDILLYNEFWYFIF